MLRWLRLADISQQHRAAPMEILHRQPAANSSRTAVAASKSAPAPPSTTAGKSSSSSARQGEMPPLFIIGPEGEGKLVNYRIRRNYIVVDRLFAAAELRLGDRQTGGADRPH
jgi:Conjugal transfer protein